MTIEDLLATYRADAEVLARLGQSAASEGRLQVVHEVTVALGDYLRWLSESEAALWTGHSERWVRGQFEIMEASGNARRQGRHRRYRAAALPRSLDFVGLREQARKDAAA